MKAKDTTADVGAAEMITGQGLEVTAEQEILKGALEDGILEQAKTNAEAYLIKFFAALGFPNTIFVSDQG